MKRETLKDLYKDNYLDNNELLKELEEAVFDPEEIGEEFTEVFLDEGLKEEGFDINERKEIILNYGFETGKLRLPSGDVLKVDEKLFTFKNYCVLEEYLFNFIDLDLELVKLGFYKSGDRELIIRNCLNRYDLKTFDN